MWRPKDWDPKKIARIPLDKNTFLDPTGKDLELVEAGADAMLEALRKGCEEFPVWTSIIPFTRKVGTVAFIPSDDS